MILPPRLRAPLDPVDDRVLLRRHLIADGWNDKAIRRNLANGTWSKLRHGAYAPGSVWAPLDAAGRHSLVARAAALQARTPVVVSHASALPEYGAPVWGIDLSEVHLTRSDGRTGRREAGIHQHSGLIVPGDVERRNGLLVTSPARLAIEVTTMAEVEPALVVLNHLLHAGLTTQAAVAERYAPLDHWPDTLRTDLVLRLSDPRVESVGETRTIYLLFRAGLPAPVPQYPIRDANGRIVAWVDLAWPEYGVFLEFDGRVKYEKLLAPGERASDVVFREKQREDLIRRLTGWRSIRVIWVDLDTKEQTAARIRSVLFQGR